MYEKSKLFYQKLVDADLDDEKWFRTIQSSEDHDFIIQNCECRISRNPGKRDRWLILIRYLKDKHDLVNVVKNIYPGNFQLVLVAFAGLLKILPIFH